MVERTSYRDGEPCWADALVRDLEAAKHFYQAVFGWTFESTGPASGGYTLCLRDGAVVAGLLPPPGSDAQQAPMWTLYLATADIAATARGIDDTGGKILSGPAEIPGKGHMAYVLDPTGAPVGIWQAGGRLGFDRVSEPGTYTWSELNTREPGAADAFFERLFGYGRQQVGDGAEFDYEVWSLTGEDVCGRLKMTAEWGDLPPHWMVYFAVADTDAACAQVTAAGGEVRHEPFDTPHGRVAVIADPDGAVFSIADRNRTPAPDAA